MPSNCNQCGAWVHWDEYGDLPPHGRVDATADSDEFFVFCEDCMDAVHLVVDKWRDNQPEEECRMCGDELSVVEADKIEIRVFWPEQGVSERSWFGKICDSCLGEIRFIYGSVE